MQINFDLLPGVTLRPGGLMLITGPKCDGKTTVATNLILDLAAQGKEILYVTNESYHGFVHEHLKKAARQKFQDPNQIYPKIRVASTFWLLEVLAAVRRYRPDVFCVDWAYPLTLTGDFLKDNELWKDLTYEECEQKRLAMTLASLKQAAQSTNSVGILTAQLSALAYVRDPWKYLDLLVGLRRVDENTLAYVARSKDAMREGLWEVDFANRKVSLKGG